MTKQIFHTGAARIKSWVFSWRWTLGFLFVILLAIAVRVPFLHLGHVDEVHTIGRALQIIYTGELNPKFFYHPSGTMYITIPWNIMALASMSREVGGRPGVGNSVSPLDMFKREYPQPVQHNLYEKPVSYYWDMFRAKVRRYNMLLIPVNILLLAYIGYHAGLYFPALAAAALLAFCGASIRDSVYVSVNSTTATFNTLAFAAIALYASRPFVMTFGRWLLQLAVISLFIGLAVACKYNAGTFLLMPIIFAAMTGWNQPKAQWIGLEKFLLAIFVCILAMSAGFTLLSPYWFQEMPTFIHDVLYQVWYFKNGHKEYNTHQPGLEMAWVSIQSIARQMTWVGLIASIASWMYLSLAGFLRLEQFSLQRLVLIPGLLGCLAFLLLMFNQAVFFDRNFSIMWTIFFFCCASGWWIAAGLIAERLRVQNVRRFQRIVTTVLLLYCIIKANLIDPFLFGSSRGWYEQNNTVLDALKYWFT